MRLLPLFLSVKFLLLFSFLLLTLKSYTRKLRIIVPQNAGGCGGLEDEEAKGSERICGFANRCDEDGFLMPASAKANCIFSVCALTSTPASPAK